MAKRYTDDEVLAVSRRMERGVKVSDIISLTDVALKYH